MTKNCEGKTILIVSGGTEAVPIIKEAKEMGLRVVVSDGDENAPGFEFADETIVMSTYNPKKTARMAAESSAKQKIDGVMSAAADVPFTVAFVAKELRLPGISIDSANFATDKVIMKGIFQESRIVAIPRFAAVDSLDHLERMLPEIDVPIVIKPVDSRGARGVVRLNKEVDLRWAYEQAYAASPSGNTMIESWVEGPQISTESIVTPEGIVTPGLSDRNYDRMEEFAPFVIEDGGDLPALITEAQSREIDALIKNAASVLGIERGIIKGDIVLGPDGPVLIEVAPRLSGGFFCTHTGPLSSGVNLVEAAIKFALGMEVSIEDYRPEFSTHVCQRFLFPEPGVVSEVRVPDRLYNEDNIAFLNIGIKVGDIVERVVSHPCRAGSVVTSGATRDEAQKAAASVLSRIEIITRDE